MSFLEIGEVTASCNLQNGVIDIVKHPTGGHRVREKGKRVIADA